MSAPASAFHDLDHYVALPRVSGLALSPDGTRLAYAWVPEGTNSHPDITAHVWTVALTGTAEPTQLTTGSISVVDYTRRRPLVRLIGGAVDPRPSFLTGKGPTVGGSVG